jgi:DNA-binding XRE family transcriptional regulator
MKKNQQKPLTFEEKLKKYAVPLEDILTELSPEEKREVEAISQYFSLLNKLYRLRKKLKFSQAELAKRSSVPRSTISKIESGQRNATINTLSKLAQAMGRKLQISFV